MHEKVVKDVYMDEKNWKYIIDMYRYTLSFRI